LRQKFLPVGKTASDGEGEQPSRNHSSDTVASRPKILQNRPNKKMIGQENLPAVRPLISDKIGRKKYCMKNKNFPLIYWLL
jgi:hypothetical protein